MEYSIALFSTVREVMKADTICRQHAIGAVIIPVPEKISNQCGMCLKLPVEKIARFLELMQQNKIDTTLYEQHV